ncbi:MAG: hypothetical protein AAFV07_03485 [Bacteroidota bacterium]
MMLRIVCWVGMMIGLFSMGHTQFFLKHRIRVDVQTEALSIEGAKVVRAGHDTLELGIPGTELVRHIAVKDLQALRIYRPSQWKRGAWVGGLIGLPIVRLVAEEANVWGGVAVASIPLGLAMLIGNRHKLDLTTTSESDLEAAYAYLHPWLRRASGRWRSPGPEAIYSRDYALYPYLRPRRIRIHTEIGWMDYRMAGAVRRVMQQAAGKVMDGAYFHRGRGVHPRLSVGYSLDARSTAGVWLIPKVSISQFGCINYNTTLSNGQEAYFSGAMGYRLSQTAWGMSYAYSLRRDDRRWLRAFMPRLETGVWGLYSAGSFSLGVDGYGGVDDLSLSASSQNRQWRWGAYWGLSLDWYITRYVFLTTRYVQFLNIGAPLTIPETIAESRDFGLRIGTEAAEIPMYRGAFSVGIGVRI